MSPSTSHWTFTVVIPLFKIPKTIAFLPVVLCLQRPPILRPLSKPKIQKRKHKFRKSRYKKVPPITIRAGHTTLHNAFIFKVLLGSCELWPPSAAQFVCFCSADSPGSNDFNWFNFSNIQLLIYKTRYCLIKVNVCKTCANIQYPTKWDLWHAVFSKKLSMPQPIRPQQVLSLVLLVANPFVSYEPIE